MSPVKESHCFQRLYRSMIKGEICKHKLVSIGIEPTYLVSLKGYSGILWSCVRLSFSIIASHRRSRRVHFSRSAANCENRNVPLFVPPNDITTGKRNNCEPWRAPEYMASWLNVYVPHRGKILAQFWSGKRGVGNSTILILYTTWPGKRCFII